MVGLWLLGRRARVCPGRKRERPRAARNWPRRTNGQDKQAEEKQKKAGTGKTIAVFLAASAVTLVAGVVLEQSGDGIARHLHMTGVLFGATVLAAATSLPEVSTGLASIKMGDYQLAISDIFGGNAFLPVLFLLADLFGPAVLPQAKKTDIYLAGLGSC